MSGHVEASSSPVAGEVEGATPLISFEEAFGLHCRSVYRMARAIVNDASLAEDIVQEVFLKLFHNFQKVPKDELLRLWLLRVTSNVARNIVRARTRATMRDDSFAKAAVPEGASTPTPEDTYEQQVELEKALRALNSLREPMRSCLLLKQQGLSYREIAAALSLNEKSVGSLLTRGQREFLDFYARSGGSRWKGV
jgi:RNA polymerase sigma factor (sigma-70 family)